MRLASQLTNQSSYSLWKRLSDIGGSALFGYLSLFALQTKVLWGAWQNWDLPLYDGAAYFFYARRLATFGVFPPIDWSPAFAVYYMPFHIVLGGAGPFVVYFAHRIVTLFLVLGLLYMLLRTVLPAVVAWVLAACFIVLATGLNNVYVVHLFVLIPLLIAYRAGLSNSPYRNSIIMISLLVAGLVRSEFLLALALMTSVLILLDWRRARAGQPVSWRKAYLLALLAGMLTIIPMVRAGPSHTSIDRSWGAFEQHYAWGYRDRHPDWNADFWFKYEEAVQLSFGDAQSIAQAAANNPPEMLRHMLWNLGLLPATILDVFTSLPGAEGVVVVIFALGIVGLLVSLIENCLDWRETPRRVRWIRDGKFSLLVIMIICTCLPLAASTLLLRPRTIYLLPLIPVLFLIVGAGLKVLLDKIDRRQCAPRLLPALFVVFLIVFPAPFNQTAARDVMAAAKVIKTLPIEGDYALLGPSALGLCVYSNPVHCSGVEISSVPKDVMLFADFISDRKVRVIVVNGQVANNLPEAGRAYIAELQARPTEGGWIDWGIIGPFHFYWQNWPK